jgi:hypothetical protein
VLTREQSVADWCLTRGLVDPQAPTPSFDRWLNGTVSGDWTGAEHERALARAP